MAKIIISDLLLIGSGLFSDSENFLDSMQDLSVNELKQTFGGKKDRTKSKSKSSKSKNNSYCVCPVPGVGGGSGGGAN